jgi:Flp pilus assembly protein TadB
VKNLDRYRPRIHSDLHAVMRFIAVCFGVALALVMAFALMGGRGLVILIVIAVFFLAFWAKPKVGE